MKTAEEIAEKLGKALVSRFACSNVERDTAFRLVYSEDVVAGVLNAYGNARLEAAAVKCDALQKDARGQARYASAHRNTAVQRDYEVRAEAANTAARAIRDLKEPE